MKLRNAPERKRERQLGALDRLKAKLSNKSHRHPNTTLRNKGLMEKEIKVLEERTAFSRRDVRTKKSRGV